jgi:hypothetical protein
MLTTKAELEDHIASMGGRDIELIEIEGHGIEGPQGVIGYKAQCSLQVGLMSRLCQGWGGTPELALAALSGAATVMRSTLGMPGHRAGFRDAACGR